MKSNFLVTASLRIAALGLLNLMLCGSTLAANSAPPSLMSYQGFLVDANGAALGNTNTGPKNYDVVFRIYNDQSGGAVQWAEQQTITVDKGYYSILLGEGSVVGSSPHPALSSLFTGPADASDRFVEMTVKGIGAGGADATLLPRVRLLTSPYSFLSDYALTAGSLINSGNASVISTTTTNVTISSPLSVTSPLSASTLSVVGQSTLNAVTANSVTATSAKVSNLTGGSITATNGFSGPGTIPIGGIIMWYGSVASIPTGWALCDGRTVGASTTPNLVDRFVMAAGGKYNPTAVGGNASIALTVPELPSHLHSVEDAYYAEVQNGGPNNLIGNKGATDNDNTVYTRSILSGNTGTGQAFSILPPFYALAYIMRVQ